MPKSSRDFFNTFLQGATIFGDKYLILYFWLDGVK